jgi:hypothetical protein
MQKCSSNVIDRLFNLSQLINSDIIYYKYYGELFYIHLSITLEEHFCILN